MTREGWIRLDAGWYYRVAAGTVVKEHDGWYGHPLLSPWRIGPHRTAVKAAEAVEAARHPTEEPKR